MVVRCDPDSFEAIFRHLLRNAVWHAEHSCNVRISLQGGTVSVAIEDDGPGIDLSQLDRILEPFHTTENSAFESDTGLGIGLAVVKILADKNDIGLAFSCRDADPDAIDSPEFRAALDVFIKLREYGQSGTGVARWQDATAMIGNATAVVQFMGDWALAELQNKGYAIDRDFVCALSTGKDRRHLSVVDAFVFPSKGRYRLEGERRLFTEVVLDRQVQLVFSQAKGAIPVRADLAHRISDTCIRKSYELFAKAGSSVPSAVTIGNERATAAINKASSDVWDDRDLDIKMALEVFRSVLRQIQTARN